jgi:hypothetical protein
MERTTTRRKLRRQYLWQKYEAYGYVVFFAGLIAGTTACLVNNVVLYTQQGNRNSIILVILLALCVTIYINSIYKVRQTLKALPYVPPIDTASLPVAEMLVRGSDAPPLKQSAALLRPAGEQVTEPQELLRALR